MKNKAKRQEKWFWERHFGIPNGKIELIYPIVEHLNYRDSEIGDHELYWLSTRLTVIRRLDLDNSLVTDAGISWLTHLKIQELRLKNCNITASCLADLNKITTLTLLHLKSTSLTLDDVFKLDRLTGLNMLLVSSNDNELITREKVKALHGIFPFCEFIVNGQGYYPPAAATE